MPLIIGLFVLQLALVVHAMRTNRAQSWLYILLLFPGIGGAAYLIVELLPELMGNRRMRRAGQTVRKAIDPDRDLRTAVKDLQVSDTVENAMTLAKSCIAREQYVEARELLARHRDGIHGADPGLLGLIAEADFALGDYAGTIATLDDLKRENPDYRSEALHLLYAKAREANGDIEEALHEYQALTGYYYGPEPVCRLAGILTKIGQPDKARTLYKRVVEESEHADKAWHQRHKDWIAEARQAVAGDLSGEPR